MQDYLTLIGEHDEMDGLAARLILIARGTPDVDMAVDVRARLSLCLESHLNREDIFLYERALASRDRAFPDAIVAFNAKFATLKADWSDFLRSWDSECIAADWPSFARETVSMMLRLRERISDENSILYPMALHKSHIRLRPAA